MKPYPGAGQWSELPGEIAVSCLTPAPLGKDVEKRGAAAEVAHTAAPLLPLAQSPESEKKYRQIFLYRSFKIKDLG